MLASERRAGHGAPSTATSRSAVRLDAATRAADLTATAAWSRRVRWIGGLIQAAFAAFGWCGGAS